MTPTAQRPSSGRHARSQRSRRFEPTTSWSRIEMPAFDPDLPDRTKSGTPTPPCPKGSPSAD